MPVSAFLYSSRRCVASYRLSRSWFKMKAAGNILHLPNGFWSDRIRLRTFNGITNHIGRHAQSWYDYYNNKLEGRSIPEGHCLKIVTGSYKCDAWAIAACSTASSDVYATLYKTSEDPKVPNLYYWERHHKVRCNTGTSPFPDQCVGVEVYAIKSSTSPIQIMASRLSHLSWCSLSTR